ncbi:MAG: hypothetical protein DMG39_06220 [Acidobacteria bacterium]|nr:MAG: hypothetical protein DMG39_06220 [Acidobacteriota bacterium]
MISASSALVRVSRFRGSPSDPSDWALAASVPLFCGSVLDPEGILPLPSLSLKVVEDYVGFARKEAEYGGAWAMATFIEATETSDEGKRKGIDGQNCRLQQGRP